MTNDEWGSKIPTHLRKINLITMELNYGYI